MTHALVVDNRPTSTTTGQSVSVPVTVVECPPLKVFSVKFYKNSQNAPSVLSEVPAQNTDRELKRKLKIPKSVKKKIDDINPEQVSDVRLLVHTQPKLAGVGKKKPEVFELALGGSVKEKFESAKALLGKEISVDSVLRPGDQVDIHAVTKGKGFQGAVKRFGISLKARKSEKGRRAPGSLGPWCGQGHIMWKVAHAGNMGFHQRTEQNKLVLSIGTKPEEINPKGGFKRYGLVRQTYVLLKGSVIGPAKRLIRFNPAMRPGRRIPSEPVNIEYVSIESHQGV